VRQCVQRGRRQTLDLKRGQLGSFYKTAESGLIWPDVDHYEVKGKGTYT